ncbi:MAG: hypothetical protein K8I82_05315, partial [Anaerolineae bacterium]|nr:hypothetical protein [Anaerolineae bacterium]
PDLVGTYVAATLTASVPQVTPTETPTPDLVGTYVAATLTAIPSPSTPTPSQFGATNTFADPANPSQLHPAWTWDQGGNPANSYELNGDSLTIHTEVSSGPSAGVCQTVTNHGSLQVSVKASTVMTENQSVFLQVSGYDDQTYLAMFHSHFNDSNWVMFVGSYANGESIPAEMSDSMFARQSKLYLQIDWQDSVASVSYGNLNNLFYLKQDITIHLPEKVFVCLWTAASESEGLDATFNDFRIVTDPSSTVPAEVVLEPTSTRRPTATPRPTQAATSVPLAADYLSESQQTQVAAAVIDDGLAEDFENSSRRWLYGTLVKGKLWVTATDREYIYWSFVPDLTADDFVLRVDVSSPTIGPYGCGIVFRYKDDNNFYHFVIDPAENKYSLWLRKNGNIIPLIDWTNDDSLNMAFETGGVNRMAIYASGDYIEIYNNGVFFGSVRNNSFDRGTIAFATEVYDAEPAVCQYDNVVIVKNPTQAVVLEVIQ